MTPTTPTDRRQAGEPVQVPRLYPDVVFPSDRRLPDLPKLLDPDWIWRAYERKYEADLGTPEVLRIREFNHANGRVAQVSYEAAWAPDRYLPPEIFTVRSERDQATQIYRYPDDEALPGLAEASHPEGAVGLVNRHILAVPARRARVELVRYRPGSRAVLRHVVGRSHFYARVLRPAAVPPLLIARELAGRSQFVVPRLAGHWEAGAVVWMSEIPGRNLRDRIRRGKAPDPGVLLEGLESLWGLGTSDSRGRPFNLARAYRRAKRSFRQKAQSDEAASELQAAERRLDDFVASWRAAGVAHNDFYDDQLLVLPEGRLALVDYEEAGPGDPLLDVGNFLAHLRWASQFGRRRGAARAAAYHADIREAALQRFGWDERELNLREGVCLFRVCTNAIRHPRANWQGQLAAGLALVNETLA